MSLVGGLRARMIRESLYRMINDSLDDLGWFNPARQHLPLQFLSEGVLDHETVSPNVAALSDWDVMEEYDELGSLLSEFRTTYFVDIYPENDAIGVHFSQDVKDIIGGRISVIGRTQPVLPVYDYTQATPPIVFYCQLENPIIDRPTTFERPWQRYMRSLRFEVVDTYGTDQD